MNAIMVLAAVQSIFELVISKIIGLGYAIFMLLMLSALCIYTLELLNEWAEINSPWLYKFTSQIITKLMLLNYPPVITGADMTGVSTFALPHVTLVIGATGTGKTTQLMSLIKHQFSKLSKNVGGGIPKYINGHMDSKKEYINKLYFIGPTADQAKNYFHDDDIVIYHTVDKFLLNFPDNGPFNAIVVFDDITDKKDLDKIVHLAKVRPNHNNQKMIVVTQSIFGTQQIKELRNQAGAYLITKITLDQSAYRLFFKKLISDQDFALITQMMSRSEYNLTAYTYVSREETNRLYFDFDSSNGQFQSACQPYRFRLQNDVTTE